MYRSLIAILLMVGVLADDLKLRLTTEDDPPHNMLKGTVVVGSSTEKLSRAFKETGQSFAVDLYPWARAYDLALTREKYCVFSTARTEPRELLFDWIGPIDSMDWVIYTRSDNPAKPGNLEMLRSETIGGYNQDVISNWLIEQHYQVDAATEDSVNVRKLRMGRLRYWATSRPRATALLAGGEPNIIPLFTFGHTDLYLACHKGLPADFLARANAILARMRSDGTFDKIDNTYRSTATRN